MSSAESIGQKFSIASPRCYLESDFDTIRDWYKGHGLHPPDRDILPMTGRIIPGVAAGFLYKTDSAMGLMDGFVGNPNASRRLVRQGLEQVMLALRDDARTYGMRILYGNTKHRSILKMWQRLGAYAEPKPYFVLAKVI